jgi:hypothetical protein
MMGKMLLVIFERKREAKDPLEIYPDLFLNRNIEDFIPPKWWGV